MPKAFADKKKSRFDSYRNGTSFCNIMFGIIFSLTKIVFYADRKITLYDYF